MRQFLKQHLSKSFRKNLLKVERLIQLFVKPKVLVNLYEFNSLKEYTEDSRFDTKIIDVFPITGDATKYTSFDRHYVYHTSWATRVVREINPSVHIDISSSLYFSGMLSAFIPVKFYDYRPADLQLSGLETHPGDLMKLPFEDRSVDSISCLHTIEHVGLGRYGDKLDPEGDRKALDELKRVVRLNGNLLLVVPVGKQKIEFNAHRIYNPEQFVSYVTKTKDGTDTGFRLKEYAYIPETDKEGPLKRNADLKDGSDDHYACGCFWFVRN